MTESTWGLAVLAEERLGFYREKKTLPFLEAHQINIDVEGLKPVKGLVVATHPTIWDSIFWRQALPDAFHCVQAEALKKTGIPVIDAIIALYYSRMIPVYIGNSGQRRNTYRMVRERMERVPVIINPGGRTTCSNDIPSVGEIKVGGIIGIMRLWQEKLIYPARVRVQGQILENGTVADGSRVKIRYGQPVDLSDINFEQQVDALSLAERIEKSWKGI